MEALLPNVLGSGGGGGISAPGGANTQVQFNDAGTLGGDADLTWNKTTNVLTARGDINLDDGGTYTATLQTITPTANRTISLPDATGTVALVAGSSGQLVWNSSGAYAGASTLTYDGSILTTSGRFINSYNAAASSPAKAWTGTWFTTGTATTTKPHVLIEPTGTTSTNWNTSGTGLGVNAASGFAGRLIDCQINGSSVARISNGNISAANTADPNAGAVFSSFSQYRAGSITIGQDIGSVVCNLYAPDIVTSRLYLAAGAISWNAGSVAGASSNADLFITRDAANTLAQRNGTAAQSFRVYNTFTSSTNYELGKLEWTSNVFRIGTEKGSGGGTARALELQTDGTTRVQITRDGVYRYTQAAPAAVNTTATLTIANLQTGLITSTTAAAVDMTLPTGTSVEGGFSVNSNDLTFEWSVINTGSNAATIIANTDHTIVGAAAVAAGTTGRFATRRTAANTYVTYRIS